MKVTTEKEILIEQLRQHIQSIFRLHENEAFIYHNVNHTEKVVHAAREIARHYELSEEDYFVLIAAAWFHDVGYFDDISHHEEKSAKQAQLFLQSIHQEQRIIDRVTSCILATKMPQQPKDLVEQILCDADLFHLGTEEFRKNNKMIREECKILYHKYFSKRDWSEKSIHLLQSHQYHTDYARKMLNRGKEKNKESLEAKVEEPETDLPVNPGKNQEKEHMKKDKKKKPKRGIETMFRITSNNHQRLSDMADNKASIMITVNSIILSVLLSVLLRKIEENPTLTIPVILLLSVNVITIIFSVLATRPQVTPGIYTQREVEEKKVNLLFFGNFHRMNLKDYTDSMFQMMDDNEYLYKSLIKDVYAQGVVLGRKYTLLRSAYNVFMFGIVLSVIAFLIGSLAS